MACTILIGCILNLLFIVSLCCSHQDPEQLFQACEQGNLEVVHRFLAAGIDVDIKDTVSTFSCGVWIVVYTQTSFHWGEPE